MPVTVRYETLLKRAAGTASEVLELDGSRDLRALLRELAGRRGDPLRTMLIDANGEPRSTVLVFIGDRQVASSAARAIEDGDVITLMSPISGG